MSLLTTAAGEPITTAAGDSIIVHGAPDFDAPPLLLGPPIVGRPLVVSAGTLVDDSALGYSSAVSGQQWRQFDDAAGSNPANITGLTTATADTPSLTGKFLGVRSTASNSDGTTTADSNIVGPILPVRN